MINDDNRRLVGYAGTQRRGSCRGQSPKHCIRGVVYITDLDEFKDKYMKGNEFFDFSKFSIICKKCSSDKVEFGGKIENDTTGCYYPDDVGTARGEIVCKCHNCGNAFKMVNEG